MPVTSISAPIRRGDRGIKVRRVQEWLSLNGHPVAIDGDFGPATEAAVRRFQDACDLSETGIVNAKTFACLTLPLQRAEQRLNAGSKTLPQLSTAYARQHLRQAPREVGGQNRGPWVRLYMGSNEGQAWPWCAGFVCHVLAAAATTLGVPRPLTYSYSCDSLAADAKIRGIFVSESQAIPGETVKPGDLALHRRSAADWVHVGIVTAVQADIYVAIEGNTNDAGDREGYEVCERTRNYARKDFIAIS